jgi:hypothetical protein
MHIFAFAVIAIQGVTGFEIELFGNANATHMENLLGKNTIYSKSIRFLDP